MEKQRTLEGALVPVAPHRDDLVECSNGAICARHEALFDVRGCAHCDDDARMEANVAIVREVLEGVEEWSNDYHTGNSDYPDCYSYLVDEVSHGWASRIEEWIQDNRADLTDDDDLVSELVEYLRINITGSFDCEAEYDRNEYSAYSGSGCCLYSLDIGECEEQIDVSSHDELKELHDLGELDDCFDALDRDFCIYRSRRRVRNEETGYYEEVGRKTYAPYDHHADHPTVEIYTMPGGQWHFVVPAERMEELVLEYLAEREG